jgi:hypothetical protein
VGTAASGGTSIEMQIIADDAANLTHNVTVIGTTGAIAVASAHGRRALRLRDQPAPGQQGPALHGRALRHRRRVAAGTYYGDIGIEMQDGQKFYANGFAVL